MLAAKKEVTYEVLAEEDQHIAASSVVDHSFSRSYRAFGLPGSERWAR